MTLEEQLEASRQQLATPLEHVGGIGPQRAELFRRLGLFTARDLLFHFPRDYQDLTRLDSVDQLQDKQLVRLRGTVLESESRTTSNGRDMLGVLVGCGQGRVRALWFGQPWMAARFKPGQDVLLSGQVRMRGCVWQLSHPHVEWIEGDADSKSDQWGDQLLPVYPSTEGLNQHALRRAMKAVLQAYLNVLPEVFPTPFLTQHGLWPVRQALEQLHFPADQAALAQARRRLVYQELLVLQLALALRRRREQDRAHAVALEATAKIDARIRRLFPFEFTADQQRAITEVAADMGRPQPMNRLLQGDVGSGKTVVALYALLLAVAHRRQAVLMAPTEILARQHAATLGMVLSESHVRWACLTSGLGAAERRTLLAQLAAGELDVIIGTQAVLESDVQFSGLALVVIDEQHKFGVRQRAALKQAGIAPHYLVMTATPIPRTMTMTLYGDLDVSTIRESPPGRQPVHTYLADDSQRERWWQFLVRKLREGRQAYVVAPLVDAPDDKSEVLDGSADESQLASIERSYESLANGPLADFRLGLIHGRLNSAEKERIMADFRACRLQVLVATSVIEVGIDVPNATLMTIEGAQRFGLSQLHQLRGRVSRGNQPGYCCLFADVAGEQADQRLKSFVGTSDGFELAEIDFRLRGPGDLLGTRQHGLPPMRIADLLRDGEVLVETRDVARRMIDADSELAQPEYAALRRMVLHRYGQVLELGDVG
ncbi:MAG TPA: ATP-dependent DNA helicase RecG [Pirellulales bacterium]|nr:ATP-dependent DNA helicase RecG [Pirellulales bacterium]